MRFIFMSIDNRNYSSVMTLLTEVLVLQGLITLSKANLKLLWPFDDKAYAREVNINNPTQDDSAGCDMTFSNIKPPGFSIQSAVFDGSTHYDIRLEGVTVSDFSFSFWLRTPIQNGALFHYKPDDPVTDLQDIKLWLVTKQIHFARVLQSKTETEVCGSSVSQDEWYYISYGIDKSTGKMWMYMGTSKVYDKDESYKDNVIFPVPGTLRVGGMFDSSFGNFEGLITCVGFHSDSEPSISLTKTPCTSPTRDTYTPSCSSSIRGNFGGTKGRFDLYSGSVNALEEIFSVNRCGVVACGSLCLQLGECLYFQYDRLTVGCTRCYIFKIGTGNAIPANGHFFKLAFFV
ncbi:uncharacterized protein LOC127715208 [Mytilus californianus]|uniref:uncharacterized protein LOC127715208 n=1 Tax=Mytilus californianus TaxID=6549 RepID=UPI0022455004|nr:uncharacterized protein LOC127715208 [Mytilus californianus]